MQFTEQEQIEHDKKAEANKAANKAAAIERVQSLIEKHIGTLTLKWSQTVSQDDYGNIMFDKWVKEQDYFIANVLCKDDIINQHLGDETINAFRELGLEDIAIKYEIERYENLIQIKQIMNNAIEHSIAKNI
ncbi:MAG: hypothetical protein PHI06_08815 [Desulfobulbaceae bacterium]|nr:hypothetical protein [Desulfobulbaceae bacterium]